jgi:hypothetical protein
LEIRGPELEVARDNTTTQNGSDNFSRNQKVAIRATDDSDESKVSSDLSYTALVLDLVPGVDEGSHEEKAKSRTRASLWLLAWTSTGREGLE